MPGGSSRRSLGRSDRVDSILHYSLLRGDDFPRQGSLGRVKGEIFLALVTNLGDYGCYRCNDRARLGELAARIQVDSSLVRLALLFVTGAVNYGATLFAIGSPVMSEGRRGARDGSTVAAGPTVDFGWAN
jgi:hypothetical protein